MPEKWWEHFESETNIEQEKTSKIALQNDLLRKTFCVGGEVNIDGISSLSNTQQSVLIFMIKEYESFHTNDEIGNERHSGFVKLFHKKFIWKITYYDRFAWERGSEMKSENPECAFSTFRILSIIEVAFDQISSPSSCAR